MARSKDRHRRPDRKRCNLPRSLRKRRSASSFASTMTEGRVSSSHHVSPIRNPFEVMMASNIAQEQRFSSLATSLGKDELAIKDFEGHETLSQSFEFRITATSKKPNLNLDTIIGTNACVTVK